MLLFNTAIAQNTNKTTADQDSVCIARLGNIKSRSVPKKVFTAQEGVTAYIRINTSHWEPTILNSFSIIVLRDSSVVFQHKNDGKRFNSRVKAAFQELQSNDTVLIFNIQTQLPDGKTMILDPLEFKIE